MPNEAIHIALRLICSQANRKEQDDFEQQMTTLEGVLGSEMRAETAAALGKPRAAVDSGEDKLKKKVNSGAWGVAKDKVDVQVSIERVQNFEEAFLKIKAATGITDIDELVRTFIKNEDQNFSLFNYVNEQTNEIEKLEEQIQQLKEEEHKYAQESGEDAQQQKAVLKELETKVAATDTAVEKFEAKSVASQRTLEQLKRSIGSMFTRIECDPGPVLSSKAPATVTEANILHYLGLIEQRCNSILQQYTAIQQREKGRQASRLDQDDDLGPGTHVIHSVLGTGPTVPMGQDLIHVNPPKLDDYSDEEGSDDEGDFRPFSKDELKAKALNRMSRKGQGASGRKSKK
jgi:chromosome segregation ATPase